MAVMHIRITIFAYSNLMSSYVLTHPEGERFGPEIGL